MQGWNFRWSEEKLPCQIHPCRAGDRIIYFISYSFHLQGVLDLRPLHLVTAPGYTEKGDFRTVFHTHDRRRGHVTKNSDARQPTRTYDGRSVPGGGVCETRHPLLRLPDEQTQKGREARFV